MNDLVCKCGARTYEEHLAKRGAGHVFKLNVGWSACDCGRPPSPPGR